MPRTLPGPRDSSCDLALGPTVVYLDTSRQPAWSELPGPVRDALLVSSPLTRDADPESVDAYVATIAAYLLGG